MRHRRHIEATPEGAEPPASAPVSGSVPDLVRARPPPSDLEPRNATRRNFIARVSASQPVPAEPRMTGARAVGKLWTLQRLVDRHCPLLRPGLPRGRRIRMVRVEGVHRHDIGNRILVPHHDAAGLSCWLTSCSRLVATTPSASPSSPRPECRQYALSPADPEVLSTGRRRLVSGRARLQTDRPARCGAIGSNCGIVTDRDPDTAGRGRIAAIPPASGSCRRERRAGR